MKPWIHPQDRRSRIWYSIQIAMCTVAVIGAPILALQEPTRDHVLIAVGVVVLGLIGIALLVREFRRLPYVYRTQDTEEDQ